LGNLVEHIQICALILQKIRLDLFGILDAANKTISNCTRNSDVMGRIKDIYGYHVGELVDECSTEDPEKEIAVRVYCSDLITGGSPNTNCEIKISKLKTVLSNQ
jgi:hypothetical protein